MSATFLHTMVRITDPEKSRAFYEALGFTFAREMDTSGTGRRRRPTTSSRSATTSPCSS